MNWTKAISGITLSLIFLSVIFFTLQGAWSLTRDKNLFLGSILDSVADTEPVVLDDNPKVPLPYRNWDMLELDLGAVSGIAVETDLLRADKILFKKNNYTKFPIASLTKLMTAIISSENYNAAQIIVVSQDAVSQEGARGPLELGKPMAVNDLLYIMLIESSNKAAYALSEGMGAQTFVNLMNQKAKSLGMENTFFADPTGLSSENVSTADDLVKLAKYILGNHPEITKISRNKDYDLPGYGKLTNTDELLSEIPEIIGSKTGFTTDAKGCLLLLLNNSKKDNYLIYVVLGADDRFAEMKKIIDWVSTAYSW